MPIFTVLVGLWAAFKGLSISTTVRWALKIAAASWAVKQAADAVNRVVMIGRTKVINTEITRLQKKERELMKMITQARAAGRKSPDNKTTEYSMDELLRPLSEKVEL